MAKKVKYGIIVCVILALGFGIYAAYKKDNKKESFVNEVNRNLSGEDRQVFEDRIAGAQSQISQNQSDEDRYSSYMQMGYNQQGLGSLADAQASFEQAIKIKPDDFNAYSALFQVQVDRGDYQGAQNSIKTAIEKSPTSADLWRKYTELEINKLNASNDVVSALYAEAVVKTNNNIDVLTAYADWLQKSGNLQAAKEYWQKAITANPGNKKVYQAQIDKINKLMQPTN